MRDESFVRCLCMGSLAGPSRGVAYLTHGMATSVFYLFRDAPHRRATLALEPGSAARYALYGMDQLAQRGLSVRHNLERRGVPRWAQASGVGMKRALEAAGGYGGDFATVLSSVRALNRADVVFSTVDTVGIPLMLLARAHVVRPPFVYAAIGLPERLAQLRPGRMERLYAGSLAAASAVVAYSRHEADVLERWLRERGASTVVEFVPFGVDVGAFRPTGASADLDVVSVGADPHRDVDLLLDVAGQLRDARFLVVTTADRARSLGDPPPNVSVETDLPFDEMRDRLDRARVVALPVRENSYSGATTVLLQAMALAKPAVVTRTAAIATGYALEDGGNVRLVAPGDAGGFAQALSELRSDDARARALGSRARATVESTLTWDRYVERLERVLLAAAAGRGDGSPRAR
jgi:glycosyltransferase involved in cell wall biosynthesis